MFQYFTQILINLVSNLISWLLVFFLLFLIFVSRFWWKRRKLLDFMGCKTVQPIIRVYLSSFLLKPGVVTDLEGSHTFWGGLTLSAGEFQLVAQIDRFLSKVTRHLNIFDYLFDYLIPSTFRIPMVEIKYLPSPHSVEDLNLSDCTVILVGGPLHNLGTKLYYDQHMTFMRSDDWRLCVEVTKGKHAGRVLGPNVSKESLLQEDFKHPGVDVAALEKLYDKERNTTVFIASGTGTNGTASAIHYLIRYWEKLYNKYEENPFAICLECPRKSFATGWHWAADRADPAFYRNSSILLELP